MHLAVVIGSHRPHSHSLRFGELVVEGFRSEIPDITIDMIELCRVNIGPCLACGHCGRVAGACAVQQDDFVQVRDRLARADGIAIVSPHYAPIPARLCALLERCESTHFFAQYYQSSYRGPLTGIPYGMVGHGAGPGAKSYKAMVLDTIENACETIGLRLVKRPEFPENGYFVPAGNSGDLSIFPPGQVYPEGHEEGLRRYGAFLARHMRPHMAAETDLL